VGGEAGADGPVGTSILASRCGRTGEVRHRSGPSGPETRGVNPNSSEKPLVSFFEALGGDYLGDADRSQAKYATGGWRRRARRKRPRLIAKVGPGRKRRQDGGRATPEGGGGDAATSLGSKRSDCLSGVCGAWAWIGSYVLRAVL
jgi:hypothetical protein